MKDKTKEKEKEKQKTQSDAKDKSFTDDTRYESIVNAIESNGGNKKKCQPNVLSIKKVKGKNNELNLKINSFHVQVGGNISAYDIVTGNHENRLHVLVEQGRYKKEYESIGKVKTTIIPIAPVGVKGMIKAVDLDTGEILELRWQWESLFSVSSIWKKIKSYFIKEEI